jgi:hypothetical protein
MRCTVGNGGWGAWDDTVTIQMGQWRRGRGGTMVRGRMESVRLMEAKVPAGLTGSMSNRGHLGGREEEKGGEERMRTREGGREGETGRKAKR